MLCALAASLAAGAVLAPAAGAQTLSDDASLASLSVDSTVAQTKMTPAFDPEVTSYFVAAPSEGDVVTVNVTPNHAGATLEWIGDDADPNLPGHQVEVTVGDTVSVSVRVDAEDGVTFSDWYGIQVARASNHERGWRVYDDVLAEYTIDDPRLRSHFLAGVWADADRVIVTGDRLRTVDEDDNVVAEYDRKLFVFGAADSSRLPDGDFVLSGSPDAGIWSDGTNVWALDSYGTLRAYRLSDGSEIDDWRIDIIPNGLYDTREIYEPNGIWSDGDTLWVAGKDDADNGKVFAFTLPKGCNNCRKSNLDFELSGVNDNPWGITGNDDTWWVTETGEGGWTMEGRTIYAYNRSDGTRDADKDIDLTQLDIGNIQQLYYGLFATDTIMYVAEYITGRIYSFSMPGVSGPIGPALVSSDATLSGLSLNNATLSPSHSPFDPDHTFYTALVEPEVTSTTVTATPSSSSAEVKINSTISTSSAVSLGLEGSTTTIEVEVTALDGITTKTYRVSVTRRAKSTDATLSSLTLSGTNAPLVDLVEAAKPAGDSGTVLGSVEETTVLAIPSDSRVESIVYKLGGTVVDPNSDPNDAIPDGDHVAELGVGPNAITVEVTAEDGVTMKTYKVTVTRLRPESDVATLMSLELKNVVPVTDIRHGHRDLHRDRRPRRVGDGRPL